MTTGSMRGKRWRSLAATVAMVGCAEAPSAVPAPHADVNLTISSAAGSIQACAAELPVTVTAIGRNGRPAADLLLNFVVTGGSGRIFAGAVVTGRSGVAQNYWSLGRTPDETNVLEVRAIDPSGARLTFGSLEYSTRSQVAFFVDRQSGISGEIDESGIWLMNSDGTGARRIHATSLAFGPAWSPDGNRIAFAKFVSGDYHVHVMQQDGSGVSRLSPLGRAAIAPSWSPDGSRIVFAGGESGGMWSLYTMNADGSNLTRITTREIDISPSWSPDGTRIAFHRYMVGLMTVRPDGTEPTVISWNAADRDPVWSPDGRSVAFVSAGQVGVMDASGLRRRQLAAGESPTWSPDGARLMFTRDEELYAINVDGSGAVNIGLQPRIHTPAWSPCLTQ